MSDTVTINKANFTSVLNQTVGVLGEIVPKLEKLSSVEAEQLAFAKVATDKLVAAGLIKKADAAAAEKELAEGGFNKAASVIDFIINSTVIAPMGKSASANTSKKENISADEAFNRKLGL